jgi:hypothetical protein
VADSVSRAQVYPKLENPTSSLIKQVNAYSSVHDKRAHHPNENVNAVVRRELGQAGADYDTVTLP